MPALPKNKTCIACSGTGVSSIGNRCYPCKGTGKTNYVKRNNQEEKKTTNTKSTRRK